MFIDGRHALVTKAPEGRHVYSNADNQIHQSPRGATCRSVIRETGKRKGGIHSGWVPQPIGRGNPAPTMAGIIPKRESGFRISVSPKGLKASAKNGII